MVVETTEKKSRFIASAGKVRTEEEARAFIERVKSDYKEASHHVYAYVLTGNVPAARYSDDGEPHGTAGLPVLDAIRGRGLTGTIVVVTRYFGGTLLGTGGLARAYSSSAALCIDKAGTTEYIPGRTVRIEAEYHDLGRIQNFLTKNRVSVVDEDYGGRVIITALVPEERLMGFIDNIKDLTNAAADIIPGEEKYIEAED
ncbi:MAG: YigZ family protein [Clostridia bacterium]|nr:YigZ family protein [Clostridia bacterium]